MLFVLIYRKVYCNASTYELHFYVSCLRCAKLGSVGTFNQHTFNHNLCKYCFLSVFISPFVSSIIYKTVFYIFYIFIIFQLHYFVKHCIFLWSVFILSFIDSIYVDSFCSTIFLYTVLFPHMPSYVCVQML